MATLEGRHRRGGIVALISGSVLVFAAVCIPFLLWGVLVPGLRITGPPEFSPEYSHEGLWKAGRRSLAFGFWTHDHGFLVGDFGGKEWVGPLVESMVSGEGIGCAGGHREAALEGITNHSPPEGTDLGAFWSEWWARSAEQTQAEWIRRGFESDGYPVTLPPNERDWPTLLKLLGEKKDGSAVRSAGHFPEDDFAHPRRARYNAFRWLRDSGFDPVVYALGTEAVGDEVTRQGLLAYREFEREFRTGVPGRLEFAPEDDWGKGMPASLRPGILEPRSQGLLAAVLALVFLIGAALARWGWKRCRRRLVHP